MKCQICHSDEAEWAWQPFGPGQTVHSAALLGFHYRGFPVIKICQHCFEEIEHGMPVEFEHKAQRYVLDHDKLLEVPESVRDGLAWLEEQRSHPLDCQCEACADNVLNIEVSKVESKLYEVDKAVEEGFKRAFQVAFLPFNVSHAQAVALMTDEIIRLREKNLKLQGKPSTPKNRRRANVAYSRDEMGYWGWYVRNDDGDGSEIYGSESAARKRARELHGYSKIGDITGESTP